MILAIKWTVLYEADLKGMSCIRRIRSHHFVQKSDFTNQVQASARIVNFKHRLSWDTGQDFDTHVDLFLLLFNNAITPVSSKSILSAFQRQVVRCGRMSAGYIQTVFRSCVARSEMAESG